MILVYRERSEKEACSIELYSFHSSYFDDILKGALLWFGLQQVDDLGFVSKLVYPTRGKWLYFQWNAVVESPSLSVPLCGLSSLGRVWALVLLAFRLQVQ